MKKFLISFITLVFLTSIASAELLTTANTFGQGKFGFELAGIQDQNYGGESDYTRTVYAGYIGYGILEDLDAYLEYGVSTVGGLPTGFEGSGSGMGLALKYRILKEGESMPVSVALAGIYRSITAKEKSPEIPLPPPLPPIPAGEATYNGSQTALGVGISKIIVPFVPYGGIAYRQNVLEGEEVSTQLDITIGTAIAWSMQGAVLLEYTSQSMTPKGDDAYNSGQMAIGVAYKI